MEASGWFFWWNDKIYIFNFLNYLSLFKALQAFKKVKHNCFSSKKLDHDIILSDDGYKKVWQHSIDKFMTCFNSLGIKKFPKLHILEVCIYRKLIRFTRGLYFIFVFQLLAFLWSLPAFHWCLVVYFWERVILDSGQILRAYGT